MQGFRHARIIRLFLRPLTCLLTKIVGSRAKRCESSPLAGGGGFLPWSQECREVGWLLPLQHAPPVIAVAIKLRQRREPSQTSIYEWPCAGMFEHKVDGRKLAGLAALRRQ